jgi:TolA-binding protein
MTTTKRSTAAAPEDLSVRVRRGDATSEDRRALERALEGSALLRVAHRVGRDFDRAHRVRPGDDELIARATSRALSRPIRRRGRRSALLLGIAATLAIATTAAAAGFFFVSSSAKETPSLARTSETRARPIVAKRDAREPAESAVAPEPRAETPSKLQRPEVAVPRAHAASDAARKTASDLFRDANQARRAGDFELARALYAELQATHPSSDEASVSRVSLGKLLLSAGRAREADQQFRSYLSTGGKNLEEEALLGRADALARLGVSGEERRVWEALLGNHPSSVYAARARQRLGELGATGASRTP